MHRFASRLLVWMLAVALVAFTATRIIDFLSLCFPPSQQWMIWPALACFDVGCLAWLYFAGHGAEGVAQRVLAHGMVLLDLTGVVVATAADMILYAERSGSLSLSALPPGFQTVAMILVILVIVANFAGLVFIHQADPSFRRRQAQQSAQDYVHEVALEAIKEQSRSVAPVVAREMAKKWSVEVLSEIHLPQLPASSSGPAGSVDLEQTAQSNGHIPPQPKKK